MSHRFRAFLFIAAILAAGLATEAYGQVTTFNLNEATIADIQRAMDAELITFGVSRRPIPQTDRSLRQART